MLKVLFKKQIRIILNNKTADFKICNSLKFCNLLFNFNELIISDLKHEANYWLYIERKTSNCCN